MHKGFGLYSPHETTVFLLKTLLLSFWAGVDVIAILLVYSGSPVELGDQGVLAFASFAFLVCGTVISLLFAWATGSLFGRRHGDGDGGGVASFLLGLKLHPSRLVCTGLVTASLLLAFMAWCLFPVQSPGAQSARASRASPDIAKKCSEIAGLEHRLFQSDVKVAAAECLLQYDEKYAAMRSAAGPTKR